MAIIGQDIFHAKQLLEKGEIVAVPTETVYGLAANALNVAAVTKIFETKDRPYFDPIIVHVASIESARLFVKEMPAQAEQLAALFWPGPLTLLLRKKEIVPDLVTAGLDRVGIRCPKHPLTQALLELLPFPLAAPSANPFGYVSPTTAQHVQQQLGEKIAYILDGGPCQVGVESTIVGWEGTQAIVYRLGGISVEHIESIIGPVLIKSHSTSQPLAPGQLSSHYAPQKQFYLGDISSLISTFGSSRTGVLTFSQKPIAGVPLDVHLVLSPSGDLNEAARNLFSMLRKFDEMSIDRVMAEEVPDEGLGKAINDRLRRAASGN